jgi:hypothetical protein
VIRRAVPDAKAVKVEDLTQARKLDGNERRLGYEMMRRMVEMARWGWQDGGLQDGMTMGKYVRHVVSYEWYLSEISKMARRDARMACGQMHRWNK